MSSNRASCPRCGAAFGFFDKLTQASYCGRCEALESPDPFSASEGPPPLPNITEQEIDERRAKIVKSGVKHVSIGVALTLIGLILLLKLSDSSFYRMIQYSGVAMALGLIEIFRGLWMMVFVARKLTKKK